MKKSIYFFFFILFLSSSNFAQNFATKGTIEMGGSLGFSSTTSVYDGQTSSNSLSTFMFEPYVGYFIINNLELGLVPSYVHMSYSDQSQSNFGIYFAPAWNFDLRSSIFPFIEGRIGYNTASYDDGNSSTPNPSSSGIAWGLKGGVKIQVGNSSLINISLSYDQITMDPENWDGGRNGSNIFGVNAGFTVFFGK